MPKIRLTKNELKKQKETLKRLNRYLPTLELKKTQLVNEIRTVQRKIETLLAEIETHRQTVLKWVDVMAEDIDLQGFIRIAEIMTESTNIAGIDIRLFSAIRFEDSGYDLYQTPLWVDAGLAAVKEQITLRTRITLLQEQIDILQNELRITIQRINLFEKVKIPEARENIRVIQIYLGDVQTAEVVRGKIAKSKIQKKKELAGA